METSNYRSGLEESIALQLQEQKVKFEYESRKIKYFIEYNYIPDFLLPNGILIETKGFFRLPQQRQHRMIREQHPELDIRFVFQKLDSKLQGGRFTCQEWCEKYKFKYAESTVPEEWINEKT